MRNKGFFIYILIAIVLIVSGLYFIKTSRTLIPIPIPTPIKSVASQSAELAVVKRVIDGDTIELNDGRKVRYIGINTPELHHPVIPVQCFGKEAMEKNKELVEGKTISMKKDVSETDRYKRLLRYVWVGPIFVNEYLVREGYALQSTFPPDVTYVNLFKKAAGEARLKNKGLWKSCK